MTRYKCGTTAERNNEYGGVRLRGKTARNPGASIKELFFFPKGAKKKSWFAERQSSLKGGARKASRKAQRGLTA
ncbi:MAG: hypothetical protein IJT08_03295 [Alphaproteobacteria bacterium]|nr:hypothetical protein [Alphaproteobacteria bacterium]